MATRFYAVTWEQESIDLTELARLRWIERWRISRIAEHFGYTERGIKSALRRLRDNPDRADVELGYRRKRPWAFESRTFRGN